MSQTKVKGLLTRRGSKESVDERAAVFPLIARVFCRVHMCVGGNGRDERLTGEHCRGFHLLRCTCTEENEQQDASDGWKYRGE